MFAKLWRALHLPAKLQLFIMRLFQDEFLVGVTGIFFDDHRRILLFKHTYRGSWSLPGGYIKGKEHPKEGLEREIKEESGLVVSSKCGREDEDTDRQRKCTFRYYLYGEIHWWRVQTIEGSLQIRPFSF